MPRAQKTRKFRLLVVGNGPTARDSAGRYHVERHGGELLLELARRGLSVAFMQAVQRFEANANFFGLALPPGKVEIVGPPQGSRLSLLWNAPRSLLVLLRAQFVYLFFPGTLPTLIARFCRHLGKPYGLYLRGERFGDSAANARICRDAAFILAVSPTLLDDLPERPADVAVIRPMCQVTPEDVFRRRFEPRGDRPLRLLFVGRIEAEKGIPELLAAADLLRASGMAFLLTLIGGGPMHGELAARFGDPKSDVRVAGTFPDRAQLLRAYEDADLFVLPTHHEGFPRVLYEAMIKSLPVITTLVGGIPALMKHDENCLAIPIDEPVAIADAVRRLAGDMALAERLAGRAMDTVLDALQNRPEHVEALASRLARAMGK